MRRRHFTPARLSGPVCPTTVQLCVPRDAELHRCEPDRRGTTRATCRASYTPQGWYAARSVAGRGRPLVDDPAGGDGQLDLGVADLAGRGRCGCRGRGRPGRPARPAAGRRRRRRGSRTPSPAVNARRAWSRVSRSPGRNGGLSRCSGSTRVTATSICCSGSAVVTGPVAAHGQPGAGAQEAGERVLQVGPLRAEEGQRQLVHLRLGLGPVGLRVRDDVEGGEPRQVVRLDDLDVGDVMPVVVAAVGLSGRLDGVQGQPDRPVADGVLVDLEAEPVQLDDGGAEQRPGRDRSGPGWCRGRRGRRSRARASRRCSSPGRRRP